jgi:DNA-binding NtrC family response regulator
MEKARILIVDDEYDIACIFARALQLDGYETQVATSGEAALELIEAAPPDAITLDLKMPYINGFGLLYRLRKTYPHIPVAIITGVADLDEAALHEIRSLDADLRFKPLAVADIRAVARELLARGRQRHSHA